MKHEKIKLGNKSKAHDRMTIITTGEKLYGEYNPDNKRGVPSLFYEMVEKEYHKWLKTDREISFYDYCKKQTKKIKIMEENKKLYKVILKGMTHCSSGVKYGISYVVASDLDEAYRKVKTYLDENDIGFSKDRVLDKIELMVETHRYTGTNHMLFI